MLILLLGLLCAITPYAQALEEVHFDQSNLLLQRKYQWPNWRLPGPYPNRLKSRDLIYPCWFEGLWQVRSRDLNNLDAPPLDHLARFFYDDFNTLIADREFNAQSIGHVVLGDQLIEVKDDPKSSNRQVTFFKEGDFLETKVIARSQMNYGQDNFLSGEIVLQIFHDSNEVRINKVEILSEYKLCDKYKERFRSNRIPICGEQWEASYRNFNSLPIRTNHYELEIYPISELSQRDIKEPIDSKF